MTQDQTREALQDAYLIDFPDDLFRFWEFTQEFGAAKPLLTLVEKMGIRLEGPFAFLAGAEAPPNGQYLGTRYYDDPPKFFLVFSGDTDGLHWGYWFDDPDNSPDCCLADYHSRDAFELTEDGETLFEAFRPRPSYETDLENYATYRNRLLCYATAGRMEGGTEYHAYLHGHWLTRGQRVVAASSQRAA